MDYYVARWYDPLLGHFTQADTIIPEPGKSQSFDRYAYVMNNPLRYIDPSGHDVGCAGRDASECYEYNRRWSDIVEFTGGTDRQQNAVKTTITKIGSNFQRYLVLSKQSDQKAFSMVFGKIRVAFAGGGNICQANSTGFVCGESAIADPKLYAHELGHTLNAVIVNRNPGLTVGPYADFNEIELVDNSGKIIALGTGSQLMKETAKSTRDTMFQNQYYRTYDGYISQYPSDMYHGPSFNDWNANGIALGEDVADMFMNWNFNSFAGDNAGEIRYIYMEEYMSLWVSEATQ